MLNIRLLLKKEDSLGRQHKIVGTTLLFRPNDFLLSSRRFLVVVPTILRDRPDDFVLVIQKITFSGYYADDAQ